MPRVKPEILRVQEVRTSGVLVLQGRCGSTTTVHSSHCAPCHLPGIDGTIDPSCAQELDDRPCTGCGLPDPEQFIFCDGCDAGWHLYCLHPPLDHVPEGVWLCRNCVAAGIVPDQVEKQ